MGYEPIFKLGLLRNAYNKYTLFSVKFADFWQISCVTPPQWKYRTFSSPSPPPQKLPCPLQIVPPFHLQSLETINLFLVFCSMYCFPESYIYVESVCRLSFLAFFMHVVACILILFYSYVLLYGYAINIYPFSGY